MTTRGGNSLRSGRSYEERIKLLLTRILLNDVKLELKETTAGAGWGNDISFMHGNTEFGIEIKNKGAFEGGGKTLKHNGSSWKVPEDCFMKDVIGDANPYNGQIPTCFTDKKLSTWNEEKHNFHDIYIEKSNTTISDYYRAKGSAYIQIKGKGLYHTGSDPLNLGVPLFSVTTMLRIRVTKHKKAGIPTDVTAALVFKRKDIEKSLYCLETKLPPSIKVE
jgi:hypothetical protein